MIPHKIKFQDFSCFNENWVGFDEFKPITIVIGRNNSGKSKLLDLVEQLTTTQLGGFETNVHCHAVFEEDFLRRCFPEKCGGKLGPNVTSYSRRHSHWELHGKHLLGTPVEWKLNSTGKVVSFEMYGRSEIPELGDSFSYSAAREEVVKNNLPKANRTVLFGKQFRRILADRDIQPETASQNELSLKSNGGGATNIIKTFITSSGYDEDKIQVELLAALDTIFGEDGKFDRIEIRQHDSISRDLSEYDWEVYLGEPHKGLVPLSSSGSGLKTIILVLINLIVVPAIMKQPLSEFVFAFEELENNLHPALLRRLFRYLANFVKQHSCQLFMTTHSSTALDFFGAMDESQIIHVTHDGHSANAKTVTGHFDQISLVNELGAKPSDILQANGVVWVEGPSDRIYLNRLLELYSDGTLREGRDYQCAFYGGSLLSRTEFVSPDKSSSGLANLLRLNSNIAVLCDGDRTAATGKGSRLKKRVSDIKSQVAMIEGSFVWITEAKEIENYIPGKVWREVYGVKCTVPDPEKFDCFPTSDIEKNGTFLFKNLSRKSFDKCEFASKASPLLTKEMLERRFELKSKITELVRVLKAWNL